MLLNPLQIRGPLPARRKCSGPCELILEGVAAPKERLFEKSPGQFCDGVRRERGEEGDRRCLPISDDRKRMQKNLVAEQEYRRVDDVNAIRNAADVAQESKPH